MKKTMIIFGVVGLTLFGSSYIKRKLHEPKHRLSNAQSEVKRFAENDDIADGDIIFHISQSEQSQAIQMATGSKYSHCGIIYKDGGNYYVFEAIQPVKTTPLDKWIARGENGHYVIKRLKDVERILTDEVLQKMKQEGEELKGKDYDLTFEWSDDRMYCSELIWKTYHRAAGIEIGQLQRLGDFDLTQ